MAFFDGWNQEFMEFTEMEKRMMDQREGSEWYAVLQEMSMASWYARNPAMRKAAKSLMEKLCPLTDAGYGKFKDRQEKGEIKLQNLAKVAPGGHLHYDRSDCAL